MKRKHKVNTLQYLEVSPLKGCYNFQGLASIGRKQGIGISCSLGIRELVEGKITLQTYEQKLKDIFGAIQNIFWCADKKTKERFIKQWRKIHY